MKRRAMADPFEADCIERFWSKVDRGDAGACWEWTGERNNKGYGRFCLYAGSKRHRLLAHRLAYEHATGTRLPAEAVLLHSCDNPPCVNPAHLRPGTHAENMADAKAKGRAVNPPVHRGSQAPTAVLTEDEIPEIRMWLRLGFSQRSIAEAYGVCQVAISAINCGKTWSHVPDGPLHVDSTIGDAA